MEEGVLPLHVQTTYKLFTSTFTATVRKNVDEIEVLLCCKYIKIDSTLKCEKLNTL